VPKIVLASQSTSRKRLLVDAGLSPEIIVSNVDEETEFFNAMTPADMVIALAISKERSKITSHQVNHFRWLVDSPSMVMAPLLSP